METTITFQSEARSIDSCWRVPLGLAVAQSYCPIIEGPANVLTVHCTTDACKLRGSASQRGTNISTLGIIIQSTHKVLGRLTPRSALHSAGVLFAVVGCLRPRVAFFPCTSAAASRSYASRLPGPVQMRVAVMPVFCLDCMTPELQAFLKRASLACRM